MIFFITFLRALAACFITNAHYTGIYPIDLIANGGLIGDILFFAVSGYCLCNVKQRFSKWYGKRIVRVFLPTLVMTLLYLAIGAYEVSSERSLFYWLIYPTRYHFVASIIILYIPFYVVMRSKLFKAKIPYIMAIVTTVYFVVYLFVYDKSYYHIDKVREPMIRFLFFDAMLLGAWFRINDEKYRNKFQRWLPIVTVIVFMAYFASKLLFTKIDSLSDYQIVNQIIIFIFLYLAFRLFAGLDYKLEKMPSFLKRIIDFLANITLEIYLVQYVLIDFVRTLTLPFPINWLLLTSMILISAFLLHCLSKPIVTYLSDKIDGKKKGDISE